MKFTHIFPLFVAVTLAGCSTQANQAATPGPAAHMTPQQGIDKIQTDPNVPDGLKKIQVDTIQRQAGIKSNATASTGNTSTTG